MLFNIVFICVQLNETISWMHHRVWICIAANLLAIVRTQHLNVIIEANIDHQQLIHQQLQSFYDIVNINKIGQLSQYQRIQIDLKTYDDDHLRRKLKALPIKDFILKEDIIHRYKRNLHFQDPQYPNQWHLHNEINYKADVHVVNVWKNNITGRGVTVAIVDDGVKWDIDDLKDNYDSRGSFDLDDRDNNPSPRLKVDQLHGTKCATVVAAVANKLCGIGVAYQAGIAGIRVLDGQLTDSMEAEAFHVGLNFNSIYSCSWGPKDDAMTAEGPGKIASKSIEYSAIVGRKGRGSIIIFASGNGKSNGDSCSYDGYVNSIYTMAFGAINELNRPSYYAEYCSGMLAVTYSGDAGLRDITTADWNRNLTAHCTTRFSGTSAAAPIAAGIFALILQARPCLSRRDVFWISALSARRVNFGEFWQTNSFGLKFSHKIGFGVMSAERLVKAALVWPGLPFMTEFSSDWIKSDQMLTASDQTTLSFSVSQSVLEVYALQTLEQVLVSVDIDVDNRGYLEFYLTSPSGTTSTLAKGRSVDKTSDLKWSFKTLHFLGEKAAGTYYLIIKNTQSPLLINNAVINKWKISLYGNSLLGHNVQNRIRIVENAITKSLKELMQKSSEVPCSLPTFDFSKNYNDSYILTLALVEIFIFIFMVITLVEDLCLEENDEPDCIDEALSKAWKFFKNFFISDKKSSEEMRLLPNE